MHNIFVGSRLCTRNIYRISIVYLGICRLFATIVADKMQQLNVYNVSQCGVISENILLELRVVRKKEHRNNRSR